MKRLFFTTLLLITLSTNATAQYFPVDTARLNKDTEFCNNFHEEMEISRTVFQYFYDGINYPALFPHKKEQYERKYNREYIYNFDDYKN